MHKLNTDQHIQDYLHHRMNPEERKYFEKLLKEDESFQNKFEEHKSVFNAFKINEAKKIKAKLNAHEVRESSKKRFISKPVIYAIAATFIVLLGMSVYFNFFQQDFYNQYFEPYPNVYQPVVRGSSQNSTTTFQYYENSAFEKAEHGFKALLDVEEDPNLRFYYALSMLNQNKFAEASKEFEKLGSVDFEFSAEVLWFHALAELKLDHYDKAKTLLSTMNKRNFSFKTIERNEILEKL